MIRKWYRKQRDNDRLAYMSAIGGDKGVCHFCKDCGENHRRAGRNGIPLGRMAGSP